MDTKYSMSKRLIRGNLARALRLTAILALTLATLWFALEANNGPAQAAPTDWRDDFSTGTLDPAWSWVNENSDRWSLTEHPEFMRIYTSPYGTGGENLLLRSVGSADFAIQTRLLFEPQANFQFAGLVVYQDGSNFLQFGRAFCAPFEACVGNGIYFDNIENGDLVGSNFATTTDVPDEAFLRLERRGNKVYGYYSADGASWRLIGVHTVGDGFTANDVGLTSSQNFGYFNVGDPIPAVPADFDDFVLEPTTAPLTYVVNTTDDAGDGTCGESHCSLREAINAANAHPGADNITFNIPGDPPFTIQPGSALPDIADPVTIDATQDGYSGNPIIELDGTNAGEVVGGLVIWAGDSTVKGLVIHRFSPGDGIVLTTNGGNTIQGNFVGTDVNGTLALGNFRGVLIEGGSSGNFISGNLISGNEAAGIRLSGMGTEGNKVQGNFIGTDITGMNRLGNSLGIRITDGAADNLIGGAEEGARNVISGNNDTGVYIDVEGTTGNTVQGNYIGTDVTGSATTSPPGPVDFDVTLEVACPLYPAGQDFNGFVSESDDPYAPWSGTSVTFVGTDECGSPEMNGAASLIYRYRLEFAEDTQLTSIVVSGAAFNGPDSLLRVLDEGMNVLGSTDTFGENFFQVHFVTLQSVVGKVFFVEEFDTSTTWRFRQSIVVNGPVPLRNSASGVMIADRASENMVIGNLISGNVYGGVEIVDPGTSNNTLQGNTITGNSPGIGITDSEKTRIVGNVITNNRSDGIWMGGTVSITNGNVIGGTSAGERNVISGNGAFGVSLNEAASANLILGNFIGTDETGTLPQRNKWGGVLLGSGSKDNGIGGTQAGAGNLVSGNGGDGVVIADPGTTGNIVQGNRIGTDASGTAALPNGGVGVWVGVGATDTLIGGADEGAGNLISGNSVDGVSINNSETTGTIVQGNRIGTDLAGTASLPNMSNGIVLVNGTHDNLIGGTDLNERNLISGNAGDGVVIYDPGTSANIVQGNFIGTDVTGMLALGNLRGVVIAGGATDNLIGGTEANAGNLISGNRAAGVRLYDLGTEGNKIQGNFIGTDDTGSGPLGNGYIGIRITDGAANNMIGGTEPGAGNTIAFNASAGITLSSTAGSGNSLLSNSVFLNADLGIDLGEDGVTPNDPLDQDAGPNDLQNYPIITAVTPRGASVVVHGLLVSTPRTTFRLEFFSNAVCDPSGFGEGQAFLGFAYVTTNPVGVAGFNINLPVSLFRGTFVTATATNPGGSTSEFSGCVSLAR